MRCARGLRTLADEDVGLDARHQLGTMASYVHDASPERITVRRFAHHGEELYVCALGGETVSKDVVCSRAIRGASSSRSASHLRRAQSSSAASSSSTQSAARRTRRRRSIRARLRRAPVRYCRRHHHGWRLGWLDAGELGELLRGDDLVDDAFALRLGVGRVTVRPSLHRRSLVTGVRSKRKTSGSRSMALSVVQSSRSKAPRHARGLPLAGG